MQIPRISTIMERYDSFEYVDPAILHHAQDRGTYIHAVNTAYALRVPWLGDPAPAEYEGYIRSFRSWFDRHVTKIVLAEKRLTHPLGYTGKLDFLLVMKTEGLVVVDQKTPLAYHKLWPWRMAAYAKLARHEGYDPAKAGTLRLRPDGGTAIVDWVKDENRYFNLFLCALNIHRELENNH